MKLYILIEKGIYDLEDEVVGYFLDKEVLNSYIEKYTRIWRSHRSDWYKVEETDIVEEVPNWETR